MKVDAGLTVLAWRVENTPKTAIWQPLIVGVMLGAELRKAREAAGLTQEQLGHLAKVDRTYVSMLEREKNSPTVEVLLRICRAIGISASEVIAKVENVPPRTGRIRS